METLANGRFVLGDTLGSGATSTVYRARDTVLGVDRAVKILKGARSVRERGLGEARALARLDHPHILRIYDVGEEAGQLWVVMELAESGSLEDRLQKSGPLSPREAVGRILDVLDALEVAHQAGIVHRDVKPANVMIGPRGTTLLGDFGIARLPIAVAVRETRAGAVLGSFGFMPPEQRLDARKVGPAADVYATGATLYALLTGANPVDLFLAEADSPRWAGIPTSLVPILRRATRAEISARYPSAAALAQDLGVALPQLDEQAFVATRVADVEPTAESPLTSGAEPAEPLEPAPPLPTLAESPRAPAARPARPSPAWLLLSVVLLAAAGAMWVARPTPSVAPPTSPVTPPEPVAQVPAPIPESPPAPAVEPTPAPAATPVPAAAARPRPKPAAKFGRWSGTFGGRSAELELEGEPSALRGRFLVKQNGRVVSSAVSGSLDSAGQLELRDVEATPDAGTYTGKLVNGHIEGTFTRADGGRMFPMILDAER